MSSVDDFPPTGYQDDDNDRVVPTGTSEQTTVVKKKGSKLPLIIFGVFMIVAIGVVGMMFLGGKKTQTAPAPQQTSAAPTDPATDPSTDSTLDPTADPTADPTVDPSVDPSADPFASQDGTPSDPFATPQVDPTTGLPLTQPSQQAQIDPATGLPLAQSSLQQPVTPQIDPATGLPLGQPSVQPSGVQQPIQQQPMVQQVIDPATGLPVVQPVQPQAPVQPADPFASMGQAPQPTVEQPATGQPAVQQPITQPQFPVVEPVQQPATQPDTTEQPVDQTSIAVDPLAQFRTLLAPIDSRVTSLEKKFSGLERSVKRLQAWVSNNEDKPAQRSAPARSTPRVSPAPAVRVPPPVSRVIIEDGRVSHVERPRSELRWERQAPAQVAHVPAESCDIQAIVQGRVWVKRQDGSFVSYGEGDAWQNGAIISGIDPQRGINVDGRWICM